MLQAFYMSAPERTTLPEMSPARRRVVIAGLVASALLFVGGFILAGYLWNLSRQFPRAPFAQPSRLYGAATRLAPGEPLSAAEMAAELEAAGYRKTGGDPAVPLLRGAYRRDGDRVAVHLRRFPAPEGPAGGVPVEVDFRGSRIARVRVAGRPARSATLEPPLLASYYTPEVDERRPVILDELPDLVVKAVLAAEDSSFYVHPGVSPTGIARALWANLRGGEIEQGGSTITQQLVKNVYLSNRRTYTRKAKEAVIAMAVELRYGKRAILEAYLNEIYLGRSGSANLTGLGAAARAWFGKDAAELTLAEAATLAGMIHSPATTSPVEHPGKARERRDWVLHRMGELGWVSPERLQRALAAPLQPNPQTVEVRLLAPYFAEAAAAEARERFGVKKLEGEGYLLLSTVRWRDQRQAEAAVAAGLAGLEKGWERRHRKKKEPLQAALVSVDPRDGAVLAWVGGRDYGASQFDRVSQARRQAGSAFKPVIYAAAFADGMATPATLFRDSPINVRTGNTDWRPQNYDRAFHGWVTARTALEQSLNVPTVRLALQVGMHRVADVAHELGITGELAAVPAASLGTFSVSPLEMASVYSSLAAEGLRPPIHGLAAVLDAEGEPVAGDELPSPRRVLPPHAAYLVTSILQGAVDHGTAAAARRQGLRGSLAGKTGTTNDRRDSWFAGYSPDRVTVVWVGYDDNSATNLSGARAALPVWSRFTAAVRPAGGYPRFAPPAGIVTAVVDPLTGELATDFCPYRITEVFPEWQAPMEPCRQHSPGYEGERMADMTLGGMAVNPLTGEPLDPEDPVVRTTLTADGLEIVQIAGPEGSASPEGGSIVIRPSQPRLPPMPSQIGMVQPAAAAGATGSVAGRRSPSVEEAAPPP